MSYRNLLKILKAGDHSEDLNTGLSIILKWIWGKEWQCADWFYLAQVRDMRCVLMNTA
jgi:hypothetical protein